MAARVTDCYLTYLYHFTQFTTLLQGIKHFAYISKDLPSCDRNMMDDNFFIFRRFNCKLLPYARKGKQMDFKNCISRTIHTSIRSSDSHANESINRFVTPLDRQAELRVNKILVKLSQNELKQMASQLGEAIVRVQGEKRP